MPFRHRADSNRREWFAKLILRFGSNPERFADRLTMMALGLGPFAPERAHAECSGRKTAYDGVRGEVRGRGAILGLGVDMGETEDSGVVASPY